MENKTLLALIGLVIILSGVGYIVLTASPQLPRLEIPIQSHDFGSVKFGDIPSYDFELKNTGKTPLEIGKITTSCGCTTAEISAPTVSPGGSETVTVYFNPAIHKDNTDLGELTRVVYIPTNDPILPEAELTISANVYKE